MAGSWCPLSACNAAVREPCTPCKAVLELLTEGHRQQKHQRKHSVRSARRPRRPNTTMRTMIHGWRLVPLPLLCSSESMPQSSLAQHDKPDDPQKQAGRCCSCSAAVKVQSSRGGRPDRTDKHNEPWRLAGCCCHCSAAAAPRQLNGRHGSEPSASCIHEWAPSTMSKHDEARLRLIQCHGSSPGMALGSVQSMGDALAVQVASTTAKTTVRSTSAFRICM